MKRFLRWRKMTWAIALWSAVIAASLLGGDFVLSFLAGSIGFIVLTTMWFMTRPLWRRGHGARLRRMRSVDIPFRSAAGLTSTPE